MPTALITGITGQDGSYMAEYLLEKGYEVYGLVRRLSTPNESRIRASIDRLVLLEGDVTDQSSLNVAVETAMPDEIYNLAAQSFVATSWNQPVLTGDVTGLGVVRMLEAVRHLSPDARFYQASSSEMFGTSPQPSKSEATPFHPRSPYAVAKVYGHYATMNYRESYGLYCCNGICFNHESPRRGIEFVTKKISDGVARIACGRANEIRLGDLDVRRDWGFAGDYVKAMWLMLQDEPDDYVIATGENHSVRDFAALAFDRVGLDWEKYVKMDERFMRPAEVPDLKGDASKARAGLGWAPETSFEALVHMMVDADVARYSQA